MNDTKISYEKVATQLTSTIVKLLPNKHTEILCINLVNLLPKEHIQRLYEVLKIKLENQS